MACKVIQRLAVIAIVAYVTTACRDITYVKKMPKDPEGYLKNTTTMYPLRVEYAREPTVNTDSAKVSCYSMASDYTVTAKESLTLKTYTAKPTKKAKLGTTYKITYTAPVKYFLGASAVNNTVTLLLQGVTNDFLIFESCDVKNKREGRWAMRKASTKRDVYNRVCAKNVLAKQFSMSNLVRKGVCT